jgi:hypothetical protein
VAVPKKGYARLCSGRFMVVYNLPCIQARRGRTVQCSTHGAGHVGVTVGVSRRSPTVACVDDACAHSRIPTPAPQPRALRRTLVTFTTDHSSVPSARPWCYKPFQRMPHPWLLP